MTTMFLVYPGIVRLIVERLRDELWKVVFLCRGATRPSGVCMASNYTLHGYT